MYLIREPHVDVTCIDVVVLINTGLLFAAISYAILLTIMSMLVVVKVLAILI